MKEGVENMEIVIGISGASGIGYGVRLLQVLDVVDGVTTHLVVTGSAERILEIETELTLEDLEAMADYVYASKDFTAPIASGSYIFDSMVVIPCSMKTLAGVACGLSDTLITRCADICLKEKRRLVLVPRETPLSLVHLKNMVAAAEAGAVVLPACPAFYSRPRSVEELTDVLVGRVLDLIGLENRLYRRWGSGL